MPDVNPITDPQGALAQMAIDPVRQMMRQQQEGQEMNRAQLDRMRAASDRVPETYEAQRLAAMAGAAGKASPFVGGFGQLLANVGAAYGNTLAAQAQADFEREKEMLAGTEKASPWGGSGVATQLAHSILNPIQNIGGVGVNRMSGQQMVGKDFTKETFAYFKELEKRLQDSGVENASEIALAQTQQKFGTLLQNPSIAGSAYQQGQGPLASQGQIAPGAPTATPAADVSLSPVGTVNSEGEKITKDATGMVAQLQREEQRAVAAGDYGRALEIAKARRAIQSQTQSNVANIQPLSKPAMVGAETTTKETNKDLVDYEKNLTDKTDRGNTMLRNIGHLVEEAKGANFGPTAEFKTTAMKWANDLGVPLDPKEAEAMNANQVIGKIALQLATQGAKDITSRPTQMEFQKLLEQGVPSTGMTKEAFLRVLNLFKEGAQKDQGMLTEFLKFKHNYPDAAKSAGDFSDYWSLKTSDPRYSGISVKDILDTMKAKGWTWNQTINRLRERK